MLSNKADITGNKENAFKITGAGRGVVPISVVPQTDPISRYKNLTKDFLSSFIRF